MNAGDFKGAEATIAELAKIPKAGERAAVLKTKILARQGKHAEAIAELDRLIASYPKGSERQRDAMLAKAESLAGCQTVQGSRNTRKAGDSSQPSQKMRPLRHPRITPWETASARPTGPRKHSSLISTRTCSTAKIRKSIPGRCTRSRRCSANLTRTAGPMSSPKGSRTNIHAVPGSLPDQPTNNGSSQNMVNTRRIPIRESVLIRSASGSASEQVGEVRVDGVGDRI